MSTYPGENPQRPDAGTPADDSVQDTTEPTQPVGYWERQTAERAQEQGQPPQPYPTTPYPQDNPPGSGAVFNPYAQQPPFPSGQQAYGGQPAGYPPQPSQPPHPGQPSYYPPGPGQSPYTAWTPVPPAHPQSTLAMVLGLVGLIGTFFACGLTLVVSPFAWAIGRNAVKEIQASQGRLGGESQARTGMITGIVGTVLLILGIILLIGFVALVAISGSTDTGSSI